MTEPLKPDETLCKKCDRLFVSPEAFVAHENGKWCHHPLEVGLVERAGKWSFPGKTKTARAHQPKRTWAMASFDRVVAGLPASKQKALAKDISRVQAALEKERDR